MTDTHRIWPEPSEPVHQQAVWERGQYRVWGGGRGGEV